jgi:primosomal protein N' (replication factor Y) (superfamily II helicase)
MPGRFMTPDRFYADVAVTLPVYNVFTYEVPQALFSHIAEGKRVMVPFGRRRVTGYVLALHPDTSLPNVKKILDILDESPLFPKSMIPFFNWIADYYIHPIGEVVAAALPTGLRRNDYAVLSLTETGKTVVKDPGDSSPMVLEVLKRLEKSPCRQKDLSADPGHPVPRTVIQHLIKNKWVAKESRQSKAGPKHLYKQYVSRNPDTGTGLIDFKSGVKQSVMETLGKMGEISTSELRRHVPSASGVLKSLENDGYIKRTKKKIHRDPFGEAVHPDTPPDLTEEQHVVVDHIGQVLGKGYATFLLTGVAGSGKTEVYMRLAREAMDAGQSVLVLVPEIALISQVERRFRARFGECVAVLHSGLSQGERYDQWMRIIEKKTPIVIGARSAIFAPYDRLGLIIVDEEHESSYKQDHGLMYHARDLAVKRASIDGCVALLGSATPSVQSYYNVCAGKYTEVKLTKRVMERPLSAIQIVDLRHTKDVRGIRKFITPQLQAAMAKTLDRKQQVLLFLNRRGFSNFSVCGTCGEAIKCRHCEISLTLHQGINAYKCHYCGFSLASKMNCPVCGSSHIRHLGLGTEKIEDAVKSLFPDAVVDRMDRDTTRRKGAIRKKLKGLRDNTTDILVGTQMVAKGHDFPNITLVGIICADLSLNFPDFRSGVRTFQLLAQVAGRAGRGDVPGKVILQTYHPEHFSIEAAREQDFRSFYHQDIEFRKSLHYPPFCRLVQLKITGKDFRKTKEHAHTTGHIIKSIIEEDPFKGHIVVLGPIESSITRIAKHYRWQILLKGGHSKLLHEAMNRMISRHGPLFHHQQVRVRIDVDPHFMM